VSDITATDKIDMTDVMHMTDMMRMTRGMQERCWNWRPTLLLQLSTFTMRYIYTHFFTYMCLCVCECVWVFVCVCVCVCVCVFPICIMHIIGRALRREHTVYTGTSDDLPITFEFFFRSDHSHQ
jgi:uncharacterized membrane protein